MVIIIRGNSRFNEGGLHSTVVPHEPTHVQVAEQRADRSSLWGSPSFIPIARTPMLIPFLVGLFNRSFQPHLDQMQHRSVDDPPSHRLHQVDVRNTIEGNRDTLPITSTCPRESPLFVLTIRLKVNRSPFLDRHIAK